VIPLSLLLWLAQTGIDSEYARLLDKATQLIRTGQLEPAIRELKRAASLQPRSPSIHLLLGQVYLNMGTPELVAEAKAEFQQAREYDPALVLASFYIAKIDLDLGRISHAERELKQALQKKPGEHYLLAMMGEVRRRQGKVEEAIELTTKALTAGPEALPVHYYRALAWWDKKEEALALDDLKRVLGSPFATAEAHLAMGLIHLHFNRLHEAETSLRKAIAMGPRHAEARLRLAQVLRRQSRYREALEELAAVEGAPQLSSPYFQKLLADAAFENGLIRAGQGDAAGAKAWFERAIEIDPGHEDARARLQRSP
jgi:predicted Zn-dependent protease